MKSIIFDAGPVISFALNGLLDVFDDLKKIYSGKFLVGESVKEEIIERPFKSKKFKFESIRIMKKFENSVFETMTSESVKEESQKLSEIANNIFSARGKAIQIVHAGELETIALAVRYGCDAIVVDEKTTTLLLENPLAIVDRFQKKLHTKVHANYDKIEEFKKLTENVKVIRSVELVMVAYERGLLARYFPEKLKGKDAFVEAILWALKLNGCAISEREIDEFVKIERKS